MINFTLQRFTKALGLAGLTFSGLLLNAQAPAQKWDWTLAGPVYNAGRIRNMVVDNSNPAKLYVGSTTSGLFVSINSGSKWSPINDQEPVKNISYIAQATDGTLYAATGEGFLREGQRAKSQPGTGLYKLVGADLVPVASHTILGTIINRIACGPSGQIAVAGNKGVLVSLGGGAFTQVTLPGASTHSLAYGQDVKFDSNGILYCTFGTSYGVSNASTGTKIYKSTDATLTSFNDITPSSSVLGNVGNTLYGRIELAIAPSNNNVIYASCANKYVNDLNFPPSLKGLFVSYDAGSTWGLLLQGSPQLDPLTDGATTASGDYSQVLMVSSNNPDILFFGGYSLYIFQRTGGTNSSPIGTWVQPSQQFLPTFQNYIHQNIHDIKFVPGTPNKYFFVTDAGIYRSTDLSAITQTLPPSFQPFYKDLVTGQYNSVSIERYPWSDYDELVVDTMNVGQPTSAYSGFIGGTGGNGVTYFSGRFMIGDTSVHVNEEVSYLSGDVYATEYSKVSYNSAIIAVGNGRLYRAPDVRKSAPVPLNINSYTGPLQKLSVVPNAFENPTYTVTGTPFKFWENYGQAAIAPDSMSFYNDTIRALASMNGINELTTTATFSFGTVRPNKFAMIDSIAIRTGTVILPSATPSLNIPFTTGQLITMKLDPSYVMSPSVTVLTGTNLIKTTGPVSAVKDPTITLNTSILSDVISVTFDQPPFATKTASSSSYDYAAYYKVFATIYYKYKAGDTLIVSDNNITTEINTYKLVVPQGKTLNWNYGTWPAFTITANITPSLTPVSNPTYVLTSTLNPNTQSQSSPVFTVSPYSTSTTYTIDNLGTFTMSAKQVTYQVKGDPITYTLNATGGAGTYTMVSKAGSAAAVTLTQTSGTFVVAPTSTATTDYTITAPGGSPVTNSSVPGSTFAILPSAAMLSQSTNSFNVLADTLTTFTITQTTSLTSQSTFSTLGATDYVLNPGNVVQTANPLFTVNVTSPGAYTLTSVSSNTALGANTIVTYSPRTVKTVTFSMVPFAKNNSRLKVPMRRSSRLAFFLKSNQITGGASEAVMVSKNALSLNDPLSAIRISQTGCFTDSANGNPSFATITIPGKPTMLEWSKSGTELYYATSDNKLYRVSHIYDIMDYSSNSYNGKFATDVFTYGSSGVGNSGNVSTVSPFRTTLVGQFDKPITSIVVSNNNKNVMVTLNNPTATASGTSGVVMYSNVPDIRTTVNPVTGWSRKDNGLTGRIVNCSMIEKSSNQALVGTDIGVFQTDDVSAGSPTWVNVNTKVSDPSNQLTLLPRVEVFDIRQQTMGTNECYNSGQIYVATNGRGVWTNNYFFTPTYVGIEEYETKQSQGNNLLLYPNPTNSQVNIVFNSTKQETATVQIMDISGRLIQTESMGNIQPGDVNYSFDTRNLNSGVYIVNIRSTSGVKRVSKLIVTK